MARERLTRQSKDADTSKQASPPAQTPNVTRTEAPDHPAYKADPGPDDYLIGDGSPSQFAEDVHPGPYAEAAAPATPGYQEQSEHPAAKPGQPMKASEQKRKETERRAAKCIRIAGSMLGDAAEGVSQEQHVAAIENHALDLMDLPEDNIKSMLQRLGMDDDDDDDDDGSDKEASMSVTAAKDIVAAIDSLKVGLSRIADHMGIEASSLFAQMDDMMVEEDYDMPADDDAGMLDEMLADSRGRAQNDAESGYAGMDMGDEEEMLAAMLSGTHYASDDEAPGDDDDAEEMEDAEDKDTERTEKDDAEVEEAEGEEEKEGSKKKAKGKIPPQFLENIKKKKDDAKDGDDDDDDDDGKKASEDEIILAADSDPMGLMDTSPTPDASELAKLYMTADDDESAAASTEIDLTAAEDQDEASDEDDDAKMSAKKAALKPQPKKASKGAQALGNVTKVASSESGDLSSLWEHAPDVSSVFS